MYYFTVFDKILNNPKAKIMQDKNQFKRGDHYEETP